MSLLSNLLWLSIYALQVKSQCEISKTKNVQICSFRECSSQLPLLNMGGIENFREKGFFLKNRIDNQLYEPYNTLMNCMNHLIHTLKMKQVVHIQ